MFFSHLVYNIGVSSNSLLSWEYLLQVVNMSKLSKSRRKSSQYKMKVLEDFLKVSNSQEEYTRSDLKCFLTDEEYEAVAEMLDLPPLGEINQRAQQAHGSLYLSK
uniref:Uncharacterized protein n=1 Tax=Cacopsylla melanoneura TaxID=428564 RepID=A0A8D8W5E8_9HEMI